MGVLRKGTGLSHPKVDAPCECHYAGTTPSLTPDAIDKPEEEWSEFDSSYKRGEPTTFAPAQVIKGWTEAMQMMVEGDKWEMYIPSELGYGDSGQGEKIKGGDVLIFRMELLKIKGGKKRLKKCNFKTQRNCEPEEVALLERWADKPIVDIENGAAELRNTKEDASLDNEAREKAKEDLLFVMKILAWKRRKNEL